MQEAQNAIIQMRFPQKLWYLLNLHTNAISGDRRNVMDAVLWGGTGRTILLNYRVLQHYLQCDHSIFKTTNISSFIRQLNLYGFRKVTSHFQDPLCNSSNPYMHEFIHDYFQYGRPELLNKITRKALTLKRSFKSKSFENSDQIFYISPLQKARRALRLALKKAAQDMLALNTPKDDSSSLYTETTKDYFEDEENVEVDWFIQDDITKESQDLENPDSKRNSNENSEITNYGEMTQDGFNDFPDNLETSQHNNENFSGKFLSMPNLDNYAENSDVDVLSDFNINTNIEQGNIKRTASTISIESNSLNCVLPSVNSQIDDVTLTEKNNDTNLYNGEWDQMVYDIMNNKNPNQELSNFRELYSQISQTIDLLNS